MIAAAKRSLVNVTNLNSRHSFYRSVISVHDDKQERQAKKSHGIPFGIQGQPTCHTHPHMVRPGELVPGLSVAEFKNRRLQLMKRLVNSVPKEKRSEGHTVVIPSAPKQFISDKIPHVFRQSSDFYYLTGCAEPDSALIMTCLPNCENIHQTALVIRGKDAHSEIWDGPRTSTDDAPQMFRVDMALPYSELSNYLTSHLSAHKNDHLWYSPGSPPHGETDATIRAAINGAKPSPPVCPRKFLAAQRLIKSPAEAELMTEVCKIGSAAINNAIACTKPGVGEHDIHAAIDYWCRRSGAEHLAFPPVIGGGARATAIHYVHDNQILSDGELLLVDSGCQRYYYNSDITRTWPVSGKFSPAQATLYDIVASVQADLLVALRERRPSLDKLFDIMCSTLGTYLRKEGIIPKSSSDSEMISLAFKLCPHHVSHYLGLDVHDTPPIPRNFSVKPGMVVTVEPGIYVSLHNEFVPKEFRGIGIRIEDDVLITQGDPLVMSESCLKDRHDIEKIVGTRSLPS